MTLAEAFKQWSSTVGATEAHDPKSGYQNLPDQDPAANGGDDRGSNTSSALKNSPKAAPAELLGMSSGENPLR
jgi:hypothetical protein